jgi:hypothetical protein
MKSIHSGLSTHESGKPAEIVSLAILSSKTFWISDDHLFDLSIAMDCDRDLRVSQSLSEWAGLSNGLCAIGVMRLVYGEGRGGREGKGDAERDGGTDGGNI